MRTSLFSIALMTAAAAFARHADHPQTAARAMRAGDALPPAADADQKLRDPCAANKKARDAAWKRWKDLLGKP